jgi:hypothetical protein
MPKSSWGEFGLLVVTQYEIVVPLVRNIKGNFQFGAEWGARVLKRAARIKVDPRHEVRWLVMARPRRGRWGRVELNAWL